MPDTSYIETYKHSLGIMRDDDNHFTDADQASAVDAQYYTASVYDFLLEHFNLNSYDDSGTKMMCIVE